MPNQKCRRSIDGDDRARVLPENIIYQAAERRGRRISLSIGARRSITHRGNAAVIASPPRGCLWFFFFFSSSLLGRRVAGRRLNTTAGAGRYIYIGTTDRPFVPLSHRPFVPTQSQCDRPRLCDIHSFEQTRRCLDIFIYRVPSSRLFASNRFQVCVSRVAPF